MGPLDELINAALPWAIRLAGLFWLIGAFALFRQIQVEMTLDRDAAVRKAAGGNANERWSDRDDAARRGWIAGQAVVLMATAIAMILLKVIAAWMAALLVVGQGLYFFWREWTARRAPTPEAALHARPSAATVNAGWVSLAVAMLVWMAGFRGLLN
ncbi:MAG: hypothetical protein ABMA14_14380 [Hyphomonadaceae bacterium]